MWKLIYFFTTIKEGEGDPFEGKNNEEEEDDKEEEAEKDKENTNEKKISGGMQV